MQDNTDVLAICHCFYTGFPETWKIWKSGNLKVVMKVSKYIGKVIKFTNIFKMWKKIEKWHNSSNGPIRWGNYEICRSFGRNCEIHWMTTKNFIKLNLYMYNFVKILQKISLYACFFLLLLFLRIWSGKSQKEYFVYVMKHDHSMILCMIIEFFQVCSGTF